MRNGFYDFLSLPHSPAEWGDYFGVSGKKVQEYRDEVLRILFVKSRSKSRKGVSLAEEAEELPKWKMQHVQYRGETHQKPRKLVGTNLCSREPDFYLSGKMVNSMRKYIAERGYAGELEKEMYISKWNFMKNEKLTQEEKDILWNKLVNHEQVFMLFGDMTDSATMERHYGLIKEYGQDPVFRKIYQKLKKEILQRRRNKRNVQRKLPNSSPENSVKYAWGKVQLVGENLQGEGVSVTRRLVPYSY